ncbi:MAG: DUF3343 domain-containing protein [Firmicutes bacterium]|nr:DUF3343 domain-containing protein [Bacillota bacterium]
MEFVITFVSTNHAIKAEKLLLENNQNVSVMPLPNQIKAGCGIALRTKINDIENCREILKFNRIEGFEIFTREEKSGKFFYEKVCE